MNSMDRRLCVPKSPWVCPRTRDKLTYGSQTESISARFYRRIYGYVKILPQPASSQTNNGSRQNRNIAKPACGKTVA